MTNFTNFLFAPTLVFFVQVPFSYAQTEKPLVWQKSSSFSGITFGKPTSAWVLKNKKCLVYDQYTVIEEQSEENVGSTSSVFYVDKGSSTDAKRCEKQLGQEIMKSILKTDGYFAGLSFPYLFFDEGTSTARMLVVYNLVTKVLIDRFRFRDLGFQLTNHQLQDLNSILPESEISKLKYRPKCDKPTIKEIGNGWAESLIGTLTINLDKNTRTYSNIRCKYRNTIED